MIARPLVLWAVAAALVLSLLIVATPRDTVSAGTFNPSLEITVADPSPGVISDLTLKFSIPAGDVQFAGAVTFLPNYWGIVKGSEVPVGARVGTVKANATLGLIGSPCNQELPIEFEMYNASLDPKDSVSFEDLDDNNTDDFADDEDGNGLWDAIDLYPEFLNRLFYNDKNQNSEQDDGEESIVPIRRTAGVTIVASQPVLLQFVIFPPGTEVSNRVELPHDADLGYPVVTVLQDIGDPAAIPQPGSITDFCSPLVSEIITQGEAEFEGKTYPLFYNPLDGDYTFNAISAGQRDADGDGYENSLDTCPYDQNVGNPRIPNEGDADSDGLDAACDPNDNQESGGTNSDQDGDGYLNRQDNCPLIANGENDSSNQHDSDLDQIGDLCDQNPDNADTEGKLTIVQPTNDVQIGEGGGEGAPPEKECAGKCDTSGWPGGATTEPPDNGDGGGSSALIIIIVVIVAVVVLGGGGFFLMRRRGS